MITVREGQERWHSVPNIAEGSRPVF